MARINLLPWRIDRRKQRERAFYASLGLSALAGALALALLIGWMVARIHHQESRNKILTDKIALLDVKIEDIKKLDKKRSQLLTRKQIIEQLQANRSQMVHLFDELVRTIPDGVRLTAIKQTGEQMKLDGVAQSNSRVASYMRNLDNSHWMGHADLLKIENKSGKGDVGQTPYEFSLQVKLRKPEEVKPDDQGDTGVESDELGSSDDSATTPATDSQPAPADSEATPATPTVTTTPVTTDSNSAGATPAKPKPGEGGAP